MNNMVKAFVMNTVGWLCWLMFSPVSVLEVFGWSIALTLLIVVPAAIVATWINDERNQGLVFFASLAGYHGAMLLVFGPTYVSVIATIIASSLLYLRPSAKLTF